MNAVKTIILLILCVAGTVAVSQPLTAEGYFDKAAKEYVKQDKMMALRTLDQGLRDHPGDARLLELAQALVKEEEQKQQQEQQKQNKKDQEKQEKEKEKQKQEQENGEKKEQERQDQQKQDEQRAQEGSNDEKKSAPRAGSIAPQDAMRMLDALERSEKDVQEKVRARLRPTQRKNIEKDW